MKTKARPASGGTFRIISIIASSPPADAPTPTIGKTELTAPSSALSSARGVGLDDDFLAAMSVDSTPAAAQARRRFSCFAARRETHLDEERVVVIGASAGGVDALMQLVRGLPEDFAAPVCIVVHIPADSPNLLASILRRNARVKVVEAEEGLRLANGVVYVAQPDRHLLIDADQTLRLPRGPRENRHRPAIDPLFRSAALAYGARTLGVVITGTLDDGTAGAVAIKKTGGLVVVQDPRDASYPGMPQSVIENIRVDFVVPLSEIAATLEQALAIAPRSAAVHGMELMTMEKKIAEMDDAAMTAEDRPGQPSVFSCPDCGGVLWEIEEGDYARFRCRVGHAYSPETMFGAQNDQLDEALWSALKTLEESAAMAKRLAAVERERGHSWMTKRFEERESEARDRADVIRHVLSRVNVTVPVEAPEPEATSAS